MARFKFALSASILLHAVVLSIHFRPPDINLNRMRDSQLEVVLVNSKTAEKPVKALARAQANLDRGGNTDENRRAKSPLPPSPRSEGRELVETRQRQHEMEAQTQRLAVATKRPDAVSNQPEKVEQQQPSPLVGADLARSALAMARLEAEISRNTDVYSKRPRKKFLGARVAEAVEAMYSEQWRQKIERVGNLNYPDSARGKLYGSLVLSVAIRSDGSLENVEINRSSGHSVLDQAALRIVRQSAPFARFSDEMRHAYDVLVITRTWSFTTADRLEQFGD